MANEEGPQAPPVAQGAQGPLAPQNPPSPQNPQIPLVPNALQAPQAPQQPTPHVPLLNWSRFKPKFSENQMKKQKLIYLQQMIGWTCTDFRTMSRDKDSV